jgi:hypothetical protein
MKRDNAVLGLIIGLLMPLPGMVVVYLFLFQQFTFEAFLGRVFDSGSVAAKVIALSVTANILPFILFTNRRRDRTGRGIMIATMLYGVLFVLLKFVW